MIRRKLQLIAGSTYTVSLPKQWVQKNKLKEQDEILVSERDDNTLVLSSREVITSSLKELTLSVDEFGDSIAQVLFSVYYLGTETIHITSKEELSKKLKSLIRKVLTNMSGTEISFEDSRTITIRVLLDKSRIDIHQLFYRITLIIDLSITNLLGETDREEIALNEDEIDRLYHLATKVITLSLTDSSVLLSSKIGYTSHIPFYLLISKKLENIGDRVNELALYTSKKKVALPKAPFMYIQSELKRISRHVMGGLSSLYEKTHREELEKVRAALWKCKDHRIYELLDEAVRFLQDVEDELVNLSFFQKLISEKKL